MDIKVSGRKTTVTDALRAHVDEKIGEALKVFDIEPMTVDVVLRYEKNPSNPNPDVAPVERVEDLADLLLPEEDDDLLVREKVIDVTPMTEEQALVQTDLLGHDFYVFENATTGLINVVYHRKNGGYGIIKPRIETLDE